MFRVLRRTVSALMLAGLVNSAFGFSLQGPLAPWQTAALSYNAGGIDVGGPMNLGEEYRWNIKTITYGFDQSFLNYFGQRGVEEVNKAIAIYNNLPPFSKMSSDLSEFPLDTRKKNVRAQSLVLSDLKTETMGLLAEELGLADPERYVWTLRNRVTLTPPATNWWVITRNFDPASWNPSPYVNGTLYSYNLTDSGQPGNFSDAVEFPVDPLAFTLFNSVAGISDGGNPSPSSLLGSGTFFIGLTRDDIGGLRYIYRKQNLNVENLLPGSSGGGGAAWTPVGNVSNVVDLAIRPGIDKLQFKQLKYFGVFLPVTNTYRDTYINITNNPGLKQNKQRVQRALLQPDIVFAAGDLGVFSPGGNPVLTTRTVATGVWVNNSAINNVSNPAVPGDGPGVIQTSIVIAFSNIGPVLQNSPGNFLPGEQDASLFFGGWAAFDGTTNEPVVFPNGASIMQLEQQFRQKGL